MCHPCYCKKCQYRSINVVTYPVLPKQVMRFDEIALDRCRKFGRFHNTLIQGLLKAIPIPPEAEPVAPANTLTAIASEISGFPLIPINTSVNLSNPGTVLTLNQTNGCTCINDCGHGTNCSFINRFNKTFNLMNI